MKKWLLAFLCLFLIGFLGSIGCGISFDTQGTTTINRFYSATGGSAATWTDETDRIITKNSGNASVISGSYSVIKSNGGGGTIDLASVAPGASCTGAAPLETIAITANTPDTQFYNLQTATIAEFDRIARLPVNGGFKMCLTYTQYDTTNPVDVEIQLILTVTN